MKKLKNTSKISLVSDFEKYKVYFSIVFDFYFDDSTNTQYTIVTQTFSMNMYNA